MALEKMTEAELKKVAKEFKIPFSLFKNYPRKGPWISAYKRKKAAKDPNKKSSDRKADVLKRQEDRIFQKLVKGMDKEKKKRYSRLKEAGRKGRLEEVKKSLAANKSMEALRKAQNVGGPESAPPRIAKKSSSAPPLIAKKSYQEGHSPEGEEAYDRAVRKDDWEWDKKNLGDEGAGDARRSDPVKAAKDKHGAFSTEAGEAWMKKNFPGVKIEYDFGEYDKYKKGGSIKKGMKKTKKKPKARKRAALRGYRKELRGG